MPASGGEAEKAPFLDSEPPAPPPPSRYPLNGFLILSVAVNVFLALACASLILRLHSSSDPVLPEPYSPANDVVRYEHRTVLQDGTAFAGPPGPQYDDAWHDLLSSTLIRLTDDELRKSGVDSIAFQDGGWGAGLGVSHNMHCVKRVKEWIWADHFYPDVHTGTDRFHELKHHADHCLESLRQNLLCHVDFSLNTLWWGPGSDVKPAIREPEQQKCVDWQHLHRWMQSRAGNSSMFVPKSSAPP